ncbi:MAG: hypothetical protein WC326_03065 [Candidatus Delongbacteria bacterium]
MNALTALLSESLDYAGLFPPAALPMAEAWREFRRQLTMGERWLLGGFVCPAARLEELAVCVEADDGPLPLVLLAARPDGPDGGARLAEDQARWRAFEGRFPDRAQLRGWEIRLPDVAAEGLESLLAVGAEQLPGECPLFWEPDPAWDEERLEGLGQALAAQRLVSRRHGYKLRCGGTRAEDFPSVPRVAWVLGLVRRHELPLKLTAGLHHPLRHYRPEPGVWMHGFLNVYLAALAARSHGLESRDLEAILGETRADAFRQRPDRLSWRELTVDIVEIRESRAWLAGLGSCSVDEPVADLQALGWLPRSSTESEGT